MPYPILNSSDILAMITKSPEFLAIREWSLSICHGGAEAFGEGHVTKMQF